MPNKQFEEDNRSKVKLNGSIIIPESCSKEEFSNIFNEFIKRNSFDFIGEIGDVIQLVRLRKTQSNHDLITIWNDVLEIIKVELTEISFNTWLKPITPYTIDGDKIILLAENHFVKGILDSRYSKLITSALKLVISKELEVKIYSVDEIEI